MKRIYIIEDETGMRDLLSVFLGAAYPEMEIVGRSGNGAEALRQCAELKPDLAIVDIQVPDVNGLEILHLLKQKIPHIKVLIYSGTVNTQTIRIALHGKADGFVDKNSGLEEMKSAIAAIARGGVHYSPGVAEKIKAFKADAG